MLILASVVLLMAACQAQPVKRITPAKGMDYKILLDAYGKPHDQEYLATYELTRYFWKLADVRLEQSRNRSRTTVSPTGTVSSGSNYQTTTVRRIYCNLTVSVDGQNRVVDWDAKGDGCRQILYNQI